MVHLYIRGPASPQPSLCIPTGKQNELSAGFFPFFTKVSEFPYSPSSALSSPSPILIYLLVDHNAHFSDITNITSAKQCCFATWMDLETVILSEASQTEKERYCMTSLICRI